MRVRLNYITPLLAAGAAAAAIAAAPTAMAATVASPTPIQGCTNGICPDTHASLPAGELPGNVQINNSAGAVPFSPQYPYAEGGYIGGYGSFGHGGFGGGHGSGGGGGHGK